jgi:hypothetical protein
MNRVFECRFSKQLTQVVAIEKNASGLGRAGGGARTIKRVGIALAVALLGACSSGPGGWNYAASSGAAGNGGASGGAQVAQRA